VDISEVPNSSFSKAETDIDVSICIPCYNGAGTISRCLQSVMQQELSRDARLEIIVVDDGSVDGTRDILRSLGHDERVRIFFNYENLGFAENWRKALSLAQGHIVTLLHQDDWYDPCVLEGAHEWFEDKQVVLVAFARHVQRSEDGASLGARKWRAAGLRTGSTYVQELVQFQDCPPPSQTFMRMAALPTERLYDPTFKYCPELDLYIRMALRYPQRLFVHDPRPMIGRTRSPNQYSKRHAIRSICDYVRIYDLYSGYLSGAARRVSLHQLCSVMSKRLTQVISERDCRQLQELMRDSGFHNWSARHPFACSKVVVLSVARGIGRWVARSVGRRLALVVSRKKNVSTIP
jgi:glycosyltransferase involved in cell wall biosynthesis